MWSMNEFYTANERVEEMRRSAEKHNAIVRMKAANDDKQPDKQAEKPQKLLERVRKVLR